MANRTVKDAHSVRGTNPQYLIEKIIRSRIYDSRYWKEECFALTAELLVDKAMELKFIGGVYGGNVKPTPFLCLLLKMLQIQPEKDIVVEFIRQEDFKYVRALGANYMRLVGSSLDCYKYLEPLYNDYRKLRRQNRDGTFAIVHMDELIDELLREERAADVILPRIQKRHVLEETNELDPRISALEDDVDDVDSAEEEEDPKVPAVPQPKKDAAQRHRSSPSRHKTRPSQHGVKEHRERDKDLRDKGVKEHRDRDFREVHAPHSRDRDPREREPRDMRDRDLRERDFRDRDMRDRDLRDRDYRDYRDTDYREKDYREKDYREKEKDYRDRDYRDHHTRRHKEDRKTEKRKSNK
uniref:Pre-mRNA-splicing factor 38 n=2 Tax=Ixodes ricinus TaxID=34613 RepID=A0A131XTF8_IXORI